jgi:hypothetical protein
MLTWCAANPKRSVHQTPEKIKCRRERTDVRRRSVPGRSQGAASVSRTGSRPGHVPATSRRCRRGRDRTLQRRHDWRRQLANLHARASGASFVLDDTPVGCDNHCPHAPLRSPSHCARTASPPPTTGVDFPGNHWPRSRDYATRASPPGVGHLTCRRNLKFSQLVPRSSSGSQPSLIRSEMSSLTISLASSCVESRTFHRGVSASSFHSLDRAAM